MTAANSSTATAVTPLLFGKRRPVAPAVAAQYVGTSTELDIKGNA